jgi:hypothetical protein
MRRDAARRPELDGASTTTSRLKAANTAKRFDPEHFSDGTIRVDCAVPEIYKAMTGAWPKPQVTGPDGVFGTHRV